MPPISVTAGHVTQVRQVVGRFAHHHHQAAALLQRHVRGARDEVVGQRHAPRPPACASSTARSTMPAVGKCPAAPAWRQCRARCTRGPPGLAPAPGLMSSSCLILSTPGSETTRCDSTSGTSRRACSMPHGVQGDPVGARRCRPPAGASAMRQAAVAPTSSSSVFSSPLSCIWLMMSEPPTNSPLHVQLRDGRPVGEFLDALADFVVVQHVDGDQLLHATALQQLDGLAGETALRELRPCLS